MNPLEPTPELLLEYLYGLLEEDQQKQVAELVTYEPEWQAALKKARAHKNILAEAAKATFAEVRFEPPKQDRAAPPKVAGKVQPVRPRRTWMRYALAASVLFMLLLGGIIVAGVAYQQHQITLAQADFDRLRQQDSMLKTQYTSEVKQEQEKILALQEKIKQLETQWKTERTKVAQDTAKHPLQVLVTGPRTLQAGALNQYKVQTRQVQKKPGGLVKSSAVKSTIQARVIDPELPAEKQVLFDQTIDNKSGIVNFQLPQDLPVQPGKQLELQLVALDDTGVKAAVSEKLPLIGALYLTHLTTDRPLYRPGEKVFFRSLTLDRFDLKPPQETFELVFTMIEPTGKRNEFLRGTTHLKDQQSLLLRGPDGKPVTGIGAGEFALPKNAPGGEWTLEVAEAGNRFPGQTRKFLVNNYQAPQLNKEVEFTRKSYGPGDEVVVRLTVTRADGNAPVKNQKVIPTIQVDNVRDIAFEPSSPVTDKNGKVELRFKLPGKDQITDGNGTVALQCFAGEHHETIVRPIPIVLNRLDVYFYPEGGDLVAGVTNRVYFEVKNKKGKPAELQGQLADGSGATVKHNGKPVEIATFHDDKEVGANQGMGLFEFVPAHGETYKLKIDTPIGIEGKYGLPEVKKEGVVLNIAQGVFTDKIKVKVTSADRERKLLIGAYCRGQMLAHTTLTAAPGKAVPVTLVPTDKAGGVYRITVFEYRDAPNTIHLVPVAERLVWRRPVEKLNFKIASDKGTYAPGEPVTITIDATNEAGQPAPAIVLAQVVNQSIVKLADDKTARDMPTHFFLATEIKGPEELEYADFLVQDGETAATALDLLLGTQGWRRFVEQTAEDTLQPVLAQPPAGAPVAPVQKAAAQAKDVARLLLVNGQDQPKTVDLTKQAKLAVDQQYAAQWQEQQQELANIEKQSDQKAAQHQQSRFTIQQGMQAASQRKSEAQLYLQRQVQFSIQLALGLLATALLLVGVFSILLGFMGRAVDARQARANLRIGAASLLILFLMGLGTMVYVISQGERQLRSYVNLNAGMVAQKEDVAMAPMAPEDEGRFGMVEGKVIPDADLERFEANAGEPKSNLFKAEPNLFDPGVPPLAEPADGIEGKGLAKGQMAPGEGMGGDVKNWKDEPQQAIAKQEKAIAELDIGGMPAADADMRIPAPGFLQMQKFGRKKANIAEKGLRDKGALLQLAANRLGHEIPFPDLKQVLPPDPQPLVVRQYAHQNYQGEGGGDGVRRDFTETLYWQPALVLADGKGEINFHLSDSLATFEVTVWGHSLDGRLGAGKAEIVSKLPFSIDPKVPFEISSTDKVIVPVTLTSDRAEFLGVNLQVMADNLQVLDKAEQMVAVPGDARVRQLFTFQPNVPLGEARLLFSAKNNKFGGDSIERTFQIVPEGFPYTEAVSDMLEGSATHTLKLPQQVVKGSVQLRVQVFPSTLADLQKGLDGMLREPSGCFEQTSSSNYPNVMILSYLKESEQANPDVEKKARQLMDSGYNKLTSFECQTPPGAAVPKKGYEWFGGTAPPHEALTAYGLLQFGDMQKVGFKVDAEMLQRTEKYLLDQRDGKGGFKRNTRALDSFGRAPDHITDAYIIFALTEFGSKEDLSKELQALQGKAETENDPYFLALVGLSLHNAGQDAEAVEVFKKLRDFQKDDGHLSDATTSITSSGGRDLQIETTALGVLGWLRANRPADFNTNVQKAVQWIGQQRGGYGGFGSTQSTILALKALIAHAKDNKKTVEAGDLKLFINGSKEPVDALWFPAGCTEELFVSLPSEELLKPGDNKIRVEMTGAKNVFPYTLTFAYNTLKPDNVPDCPVHLTTQLDRTEATEGQTVKLNATVQNQSGKGQGMTVAIIGLPAGLNVPEDMKQLKEMALPEDGGKKPGKIAAFEIRGRELVLYWRDLAPDQKIEVNIDLICRLPGEYRGPASRAYLYYQADLKYWVSPLSMTITP